MIAGLSRRGEKSLVEETDGNGWMVGGGMVEDEMVEVGGGRWGGSDWRGIVRRREESGDW